VRPTGDVAERNAPAMNAPAMSAHLRITLYSRCCRFRNNTPRNCCRLCPETPKNNASRTLRTTWCTRQVMRSPCRGDAVGPMHTGTPFAHQPLCPTPSPPPPCRHGWATSMAAENGFTHGTCAITKPQVTQPCARPVAWMSAMQPR